MLCRYTKQLGRAIVLKNASNQFFKPSLAFRTYPQFVLKLSSFSSRQFSTLSGKNSSNQDTFSNQSTSSNKKIIYDNPETDAFVAGLDKLATKDALKEFFKSAGEIVSIDIPIAPDDTTKGYAFIRFADSKSLKAAKELSGKQFLNRIINVRGTANENERNNRKIFVANISTSVSQEELYQHFSQYGVIYNIRLKTNDQGKSKGFALIEFANNEAARKAHSSLGFMLKGKALDVKIAENQKKSDSGDYKIRYERKDRYEEDK